MVRVVELEPVGLVVPLALLLELVNDDALVAEDDLVGEELTLVAVLEGAAAMVVGLLFRSMSSGAPKYSSSTCFVLIW